MRKMFTLWAWPVILTSVFVGQSSNESTTLHRAISVIVESPFRDDASVVVRVRQVELSDDWLRLQIENTGSLPVTALNVEFEVSACSIEPPFWRVGIPMDGHEVQGMALVNIPAHSHVWYEVDHMASRLAYDAASQKTRYIVAGVVITAARFANGEERRFQYPDTPKYPMKPVADDVCQKWQWENALDSVRGFRSPSHEPASNRKSSDLNAISVSYTCSEVDNILNCPE